MIFFKRFCTPPTKDRAEHDPSRRPGCYRRLWRRGTLLLGIRITNPALCLL